MGRIDRWVQMHQHFYNIETLMALSRLPMWLSKNWHACLWMHHQPRPTLEFFPDWEAQLPRMIRGHIQTPWLPQIHRHRHPSSLHSFQTQPSSHSTPHQHRDSPGSKRIAIVAMPADLPGLPRRHRRRHRHRRHRAWRRRLPPRRCGLRAADAATHTRATPAPRRRAAAPLWPALLACMPSLCCSPGPAFAPAGTNARVPPEAEAARPLPPTRFRAVGG